MPSTHPGRSSGPRPRSRRAAGWFAAFAGAAILCSGGLRADDHTINFAPNVDFSTIKTFTIRNARIDTEKPELNNRLFRQRLENAVRNTLGAKGLTEAKSGGDVSIDLTIAGTDYSVTGGSRGVRSPDVGRSRGVFIPGTGPRPEMFTEGTLVIDMTNRAGSLVWRGTYRDEERSGPTLSRKLSDDARKLLSEYPPKKK